MTLMDICLDNRHPDDEGIDDNGRPYMAWLATEDNWFIVTFHEDGTYTTE